MRIHSAKVFSGFGPCVCVYKCVCWPILFSRLFAGLTPVPTFCLFMYLFCISSSSLYLCLFVCVFF